MMKAGQISPEQMFIQYLETNLRPGQTITKDEIVQRFTKNHPNVKPMSVRAWILQYTVNFPPSTPFSKKYNRLFRLSNGRLKLYDPKTDITISKRPWLHSIEDEYKTTDEAKKCMDITVDEETLLRDICHATVNVRQDEKQRAYDILEVLIGIAFKGGFAGRDYLDDGWLWNCGSWFSHSVKETAVKCGDISQTDFCSLVASLGANKSAREWHYLVNSYRILPVPNYRVYDDQELEKSLSVIPDLAPSIWENLTREYFHAWTADYEERTRDQEPISVELSLPLQQRFDLYVSRLDHPSHSKAYRKYFGTKLRDNEITEFKRLVHLSPSETRTKIVSVLRDSASPFWKRLSRKLRLSSK